MNRRVSVPVYVAVLILVLIPASGALAIQPPDTEFEPGHELSIFEKARSGGAIGVGTRPSSSLSQAHPLRVGWESFIAEQGGGWTVRLDTRSGLPALASGKGIPWIPGAGNDLEGTAASLPQLEKLAREFLAARPELLETWEGQLVLDREATVQRAGHVWQIAFRQVVDGVPVDGSRFSFHLSNGNLVSFGASRWGQVHTNSVPAISSREARANLNAYLGIGGLHPYIDLKEPALHLVTVDPAGESGGIWRGVIGEGYAHVLVYRFTFADPDYDPTWVGEVDARSGRIVSFFNDTRYDRIRGWISPITDDGDCANDGCLTDGYPMPLADYSINGGADQTANEMGLYECTTLGDTIETNLHGPYIYINDQCGAFSETVTCDGELDLGISAGINCDVAAGASPGNTDAARSSFYNVGRVIQKAQYWMPSNTWIRNTLQIRTNVNSTCNATWSGTLNMYRAGNGCGNTGQLQGVVVHEWGHGMDQNDGGGYDNPSEAYADVVAIFESRESCVGRGFRPAQQCSGYGDTCLDCTGIRDMDWDKRIDHTPATPSGFLTDYCPGGSGPCGKETHCASYVPSEAIFDLATRDLPASGLDADTSWQLAERLFYQSRPGSGGDTYNCSLPNSDSCGTGTWYHQLRLQDDDDGNLNNGTPHGAAIFAAFDRHDIACGAASDPENQSSGSCPTLDAPLVTAQALTNAIRLNWDPVAGASSYRIYRNEHGCDRSQVPLAELTDTTYLDSGMVNDFSEFYRIEAIAANPACIGTLSSCLETSAQPLAGRIKYSQAAFACQEFDILMLVKDANHVGSTMMVTIWSETETAPETVILTETPPGSARFEGTIATTTTSAASDGLLSVSNGDLITAEYIDADDGDGGIDVVVQSTALADCVGPIISLVGEENITDTNATVTWTTSEPSDSELLWGNSTPPTTPAGATANVTEHQVNLTGLDSCTIYFYEVHSTDPSGNSASDNNGGQYFHFETFGDFGQGLQPCHAGRVVLGAATYTCGETLTFELVDLDLNTDPGLTETVNITFSSSTEIDPETVVATEIGTNSSTFTGSIALSVGAPANDGVLQISSGDLVTGTYRDQDDGTGVTAVSFSSAVMDCGAPVIRNLRVSGLTDQRFTVSFESSEPGDTLVEWGSTTGLGNVESSAALTTSHLVEVKSADICQQLYLRVSSTDAYGNTAVADAGGTPYPFSTWDIPGLYYRETFENGVNGWALQGDFEVGPPQGLGVSAGNDDPDEAYNNTGVLGNDLTGLDAHAGDYEDGINSTAKSPSFDTRSWTNIELRLMSYLNVRDDDDASIAVSGKGGAGGPLFNSIGSTISDSDYSLRVFDVTALMAGERSIGIEFGLDADEDQVFADDGIASGWNIDDVILKDGTLPAYGACGGCATAPSFNGAISAVDNDACGAGGVTVSWDDVVGWGSGGAGTYALYRDTSPGFTPSAGNMVASGISTLSYVDNTAPDGQQLYYLVRAETDETCGSGPNNSGATDGNTAYVAAINTGSQGIPGEVMQVQVELVNYAHVRLSWPAVADATLYRIYRSASPDPATFIQQLAETDRLSHEDAGEGGTLNSFYYLVKGVNACDQEGQ